MDLKPVKILGLFLVVVLVRASEDACNGCQEIRQDGEQECVFDDTCHEKGNCCRNNVNSETVGMVRQNFKCDINCLIVQQIHLELKASYLYQAYASYFQRADVSLPGIQKYFEQASLEDRSHADYFIEYVNERGGHVQLNQIEIQNTCNFILQDLIKFIKEINPDIGLKERMYFQICGFGTPGGTEKINSSCEFQICGFVTPGGTEKINSSCELDRNQWLEGLMAFEDALVLEHFVNWKLLYLHKKAVDLGDADLTHLLEHVFLEIQVKTIYELGLYVYRLRSFAKTKRSRSYYKQGEYIFDQDLAKNLDTKKKIDGMIGG